MSLDKNAKHLRDNIVGAVLCILASALMVVVSATGDDEVHVAHAAILILDAVGASWFTCGALTALRNRR